MTTGETWVWLAAAEAFAAWWWLEERWCVDAGHLVKTVEVCQFVCSS